MNFRVQQQDAAAQAEGNVALNLILLYRALGGGWQIRVNNEQSPDGQVNELPGPAIDELPGPAIEPLPPTSTLP